MKKTLSINRGTYTHQYNEAKEKLQHDANELRYILTKTSKVNIFELEFVLLSIFKRFRKIPLQENFNLKRYPQMKRIHSNKRCNYFHQHCKNERQLYPFSFIYILTTFEHQVPKMYASRKSQIFFVVYAGQKHISLLGRATINRFFIICVH